MLVVYRQIIESLPPSPSKFNYFFTLRDLGRVYEGLCSADPEYVTKPEHLIRMWTNEIRRVFFLVLQHLTILMQAK